MKRSVANWSVAAALVVLSSCTFLDSFVPKKGDADTDVIDRQQNLTIKDFKNLGNAKKLLEDKNNADPYAKAELGAPPVPDLAQVLAAPHPPKIANTKLVTLSVTEDVPLRDVLFELGRLANVDIEVGNGLDHTGINLRATDRPFNEVIERIAQLGHLRYSVSGNSIRVERDLPYIKNYSLDFLNLVRSSASGYTLSTNIISAGSGGGSSGGGGSSSSSSGGSGGGSSTGGGVGSSGSTASITSNADSDLWTALEASITEILNYNPSGEASTATAGAAPDGNSGSATAAATTASGNLVVNRQAGVLSVNATEAQHEMIQRFLNMMTRNSSAQVLIEAKVVEVSLADQFLSGINWSHLIGEAGKNRVSIGNYQPTSITSSGSSVSLGSTVSSPAITFGLEGGDLDAVLALTQRYGTTRTLSSPRLSAINNQQAVLTFAKNTVFFDCTVTAATTTSTSGGTSSSSDPTVNCDSQTVPLGIILSILPAINLNSQEITLSVRPTLTRQVDTAQNPQGAYIKSLVVKAGGTADSVPELTVPVIEVRELDSVMKVKSGGVMVIGGLMEDVTRNENNGVPGAQELPIVGNLFKSRSEDSLKRELIIFIKATIVNPDGSSHEVDRAVYDKFLTDPRPLFPKQ